MPRFTLMSARRAVNEVKVCRKCGGRTEGAACKPCHAAYMNAWYRRGDNAEKARGWARRYRSPHPTPRSDGSKRTCKQCGTALNRRYRQVCDKCKVAGRERRKAEWRALNPERHRLYFRVYAHKRRVRVATAEGNHTAIDVRRQYVVQGGRCFWCDAVVGNRYHVDHLIPIARGGGNGPENIVISCGTCNHKKGAHLPLEWAGARRAS
jgi:5-methylcytosine-specific restriction endonuclease McrA